MGLSGVHHPNAAPHVSQALWAKANGLLGLIPYFNFIL